MRCDTISEDAKSYQRIEVIEASTGWVVSNEGRTMGRFQDVEAAYKNALAICDALFDAGVRACVRQSPSLLA